MPFAFPICCVCCFYSVGYLLVPGVIIRIKNACWCRLKPINIRAQDNCQLVLNLLTTIKDAVLTVRSPDSIGVMIFPNEGILHPL